MSDHPSCDGLTDAELAEQSGEALPRREQMSLVAPGSSALTPAVDSLPLEAQQWHGAPDGLHVL